MRKRRAAAFNAQLLSLDILHSISHFSEFMRFKNIFTILYGRRYLPPVPSVNKTLYTAGPVRKTIGNSKLGIVPDIFALSEASTLDISLSHRWQIKTSIF